jgi:hypothetical protein
MYVDSLLAFSAHQGVTKRCRLSRALGWRIASSYMNPNAWEGGVVAGSQSQYSCSQCTWSQNKLWRSNCIFNLWCTVAHRGNYFHPDSYSVLPSDTHEGLSLTKGWSEVLSIAPVVQILNRWWVSPEFFSLSLLRISLVKTNEWEEAFFWPIAANALCCDTRRRMRLNRGRSNRGQGSGRMTSD